MSKIIIRFNATTNDAIDVLESYKQIKEKVLNAKNGIVELTLAENSAPELINLAYLVMVPGSSPSEERETVEQAANFEPTTTVDVSEVATVSPEAQAIKNQDGEHNS